MSEIEKELIDKTGVRVIRDRAKMLASIITVVGSGEFVKKGSDGKTPWDQLSAEAQEWYNDAMDAQEKGDPTPDFPDYVLETDETDEPDVTTEEEDEDMVEAVAETPSKRNGGRKAAPPPSRKRTPPRATRTVPARAAATPAARPARKKIAVAAPADGARILIMRRVLDKPDITNAELFEYVRSKGSEASTTSVSAMRSQFRQAVSVLKEKNLLKQSLEV